MVQIGRVNRMPSDLRYRDKVEAIDFIINALIEHEKVLEEQTKRLSEIVKRLSQLDDAEVDSSTRKEETSQWVPGNNSTQSNEDSRTMWKERGWRLR